MDRAAKADISREQAPECPPVIFRNAPRNADALWNSWHVTESASAMLQKNCATNHRSPITSTIRGSSKNTKTSVCRVNSVSRCRSSFRCGISRCHDSYLSCSASRSPRCLSILPIASSSTKMIGFVVAGSTMHVDTISSDSLPHFSTSAIITA